MLHLHRSSYLACCLLSALVAHVVRVDSQRNVDGGVAGQILHLFDVQPQLKPSGDSSVTKKVRMAPEVQCPRN